MQYLENDMDALFQQAAAHYPLNTGKDDWQIVLEKIRAQQQKQQPANKAINKRRLILILAATLLCLIAGISFLYYIMIGYNTTKENTVTKNIVAIQQKEQRQHQKADQLNNKNSLTVVREDRKILLDVKKKLNTKQQIETNQWVSKITIAGSKDISKQLIPLDENKIGKINLKRRLLVINSIVKHETGTAHSRILLPLQLATPKEQLLNNNRDKKLYVGVATGFDFNKGASMNYKTAGWKAGIMAGYQLNDVIALETGLNWLSKTYESQGKAFSMEKVASSMPMGMVINKLKTNSSLIEIPLSIKYDFHRSSKSRLFLNGGISSYIMMKEINEYNVTLNGQQDKLTGMYMQKTIVMPAVASLSFGYQQHIFKQSTLRIEPFIKVPLRGIGVGSLPVTTAGLQLAITSYLK